MNSTNQNQSLLGLRVLDLLLLLDPVLTLMFEPVEADLALPLPLPRGGDNDLDRVLPLLRGGDGDIEYLLLATRGGGDRSRVRLGGAGGGDLSRREGGGVGER